MELVSSRLSDNAAEGGGVHLTLDFTSMYLGKLTVRFGFRPPLGGFFKTCWYKMAARWEQQPYCSMCIFIHVRINPRVEKPNDCENKPEERVCGFRFYCQKNNLVNKTMLDKVGRGLR